MVRGAVGHSVRYRIGLLQERAESAEQEVGRLREALRQLHQASDDLAVAALAVIHTRTHSTSCAFTGCTCGSATQFAEKNTEYCRKQFALSQAWTKAEAALEGK